MVELTKQEREYVSKVYEDMYVFLHRSKKRVYNFDLDLFYKINRKDKYLLGCDIGYLGSRKDGFSLEIFKGKLKGFKASDIDNAIEGEETVFFTKYFTKETTKDELLSYFIDIKNLQK